MFFTAISIAIILRLNIPRRPVCTHQWPQWPLHHATSLQSPDLWSCFLSHCCNHHPNPDLQVLAAQNDQVSPAANQLFICLGPAHCGSLPVYCFSLSNNKENSGHSFIFYFLFFFRTLFNRGSNSPWKVDCCLGKSINVHLSILYTG